MSESHGHPATHDNGASHDDHGAHSAHDMHLGRYWGLGGILIALTGLTVALSYWDLGSATKNIVIGMALASFKVSLVGAIFMHLKGEKPLIWKFLYFTAFFVAGLFLLTALAWSDPIFGTTHNHH